MQGMGGWITNSDKDKDEEIVKEAIKLIKVIKDDKIHLPFFLHIISHHIHTHIYPYMTPTASHHITSILYIPSYPVSGIPNPYTRTSLRLVYYCMHIDPLSSRPLSLP